MVMFVSNGFIKLNRELLDHWLWQDRPFSKGQAWVDLIFLADYSDEDVLLKGEIIPCRRGELRHSINYLSERWGWSRGKVTRFLNTLEADGVIQGGDPQ